MFVDHLFINGSSYNEVEETFCFRLPDGWMWLEDRDNNKILVGIKCVGKFLVDAMDTQAYSIIHELKTILLADIEHNQRRGLMMDINVEEED
jgi:hypothetical protein